VFLLLCGSSQRPDRIGWNRSVLMADPKKTRVGVNGFGVIGKRVAVAVARQEDMSLSGVSDVVTDWRASTALRNGFRLFGATAEHAGAMRAAGLDVTGTLDELLGQADVIVDCTPKRIAAKNIDIYRRRGLKFIVQGGEKHEATGHSFVAEANYATALDRDATRVVSCNTTSIVRTLSSLKRAGLLQRARGTLLRRATDPWESHESGMDQFSFSRNDKLAERTQEPVKCGHAIDRSLTDRQMKRIAHDLDARNNLTDVVQQPRYV
jgi:glyceraldehyde-3-phosphate dehydrogenase (NAD(P))